MAGAIRPHRPPASAAAATAYGGGVVSTAPAASGKQWDPNEGGAPAGATSNERGEIGGGRGKNDALLPFGYTTLGPIAQKPLSGRPRAQPRVVRSSQ